ncbi:hypothetical protein [Schlesneria sp. DSM 10557]|uniref:hypothetical protein n=1 Tax=Schlesneria sp. DSM 10557 TaxID=3044399 RepID=UPI0035A162F3
MPTQFPLRILFLSVLTLVPLSSLLAIENDPAKEYRLTEKHGPWMVMVATFRDVYDADRKKEGLTAEEAASKLVHELRDKGIPAYSFSRDAKKETIETHDRLGNPDKRVFAAQRDMICVLAGNYEKVDDQPAQKTLAYIKKFKPKFMSDPKSGAVVRISDGTKGPFASAFLTINPLRQAGDVVRQKPDSMAKYLNSGIDYALVNVPRKYTLKVATFTGKSAIPLGNSKFTGQEASFDKMIGESGPYNLVRAGEDAAQLTYALRQSNDAIRECLKGERFESYVYHDKFQSIVTIGGFDSPNDPDIRRLAEMFHATYEGTAPGEYELKCKSLSLLNPNSRPNAKLPPLQTWVFDPIPELMEIPRIK